MVRSLYDLNTKDVYSFYTYNFGNSIDESLLLRSFALRFIALLH